MAPIACFDVFGTCFDFEALAGPLDEHFGDALKADRLNGRSLALAWFYAVQRDFTYLSMSGRYTPISQVASSTLARALIQHLPSTFSAKSPPLQDQLAPLLYRFRNLPPQPELHDCVRKLRAAGFECWAVTNGAIESGAGYFVKASPEDASDDSWFSGQAAMQDRVISCDEIKVAKPDPRVYEHCKKRVGFGDGPNVFIAAHTWDLGPAHDAGFTTAWVAHEEFVPLDELWGKPDVEAEDLSTLADRIIKHTKR